MPHSGLPIPKKLFAVVVSDGAWAGDAYTAGAAAITSIVEDSYVWHAEGSSGVPKQPIGFNETLAGATNRAESGLKLMLDDGGQYNYKPHLKGQGADLSVGIELGIAFFGSVPSAGSLLDDVGHGLTDQFERRFFSIPVAVAIYRSQSSGAPTVGVGLGGGHTVPGWAAEAAKVSSLNEVYGTVDPARLLTRGAIGRVDQIRLAVAAAVAEALGAFGGPEESEFTARMRASGANLMRPSWGPETDKTPATRRGRESLFEQLNKFSKAKSTPFKFIGDGKIERLRGGAPVSGRPPVDVRDLAGGLLGPVGEGTDEA